MTLVITPPSPTDPKVREVGDVFQSSTETLPNRMYHWSGVFYPGYLYGIHILAGSPGLVQLQVYYQYVLDRSLI